MTTHLIMRLATSHRGRFTLDTRALPDRLRAIRHGVRP